MANDINVCMFNGRVTQDARLAYTTGGTAYAKFSLAVNKKYGGKESVSFFNMSVWGKTAEALSQYLTKGKMVSVVCEAEQNRWENESGPQSRVEFRVNSIQLLSSGESRSEQRSEPHYEQAGPENFDDDEIPF